MISIAIPADVLNKMAFDASLRGQQGYKVVDVRMNGVSDGAWKWTFTLDETAATGEELAKLPVVSWCTPLQSYRP